MDITIRTNTPPMVAQNIKILLDILQETGIPLDGLTPLRMQRIAQACMAIGNIKTSFSEVRSVKNGKFLRTRDILKFENEHFGENISPGSYDDIRRKDLKLLVLGNIAINSAKMVSKATNDSSRGYCLSDEFAELLLDYGTDQWQKSLAKYRQNVKSLETLLEKRRDIEKVPVTLPSGEKLSLSYGEHNKLQKAIVEKFLATYGKGCDVLYVGDTSEKFLYKKEEELREIGFFSLKHEELPDVIAFDKNRKLLFLIEAFHCTGQWDKTRLYKVRQKLLKCDANIIYVTAFETIEQFRTVSNNIAWETEVWIADIPEHMIHFNGWKFLELHK